MTNIKKIEASVPILKSRKKVAAYARISMETERMNHSLSAQVSYYNELIQKNPEWEFAGVYMDDGISGTSIKKRQGFQQMLADCRGGKIDIILTKSIQRFARNTVDLLQTVRNLKKLGIEVRFEKEHINSLTGDGELMLSILASFAQEESRSISDNVKWGTRKRFEQGLPNGHFNVYGYRWEGDDLVIVPEEAAVVKRIFQNFLDGKSRLETERELEAEGIRTRQGCVMQDSNLKKILTNVIYTGNMLLQKEYIEDPITKKRKRNQGELPQYWVENTHESIIDLKTFRYVQDEIIRRQALGPLANKSLNTTCFTGKLKCPHCQMSYMHNFRKPRTPHGKRLEYWTCGTKKKGGGRCSVKGSINHENLKKVLAEVMNLEEFDENMFSDKIDFINVPESYKLEIHFKDGRVVMRDCKNTGHKDCWTAEQRARTSAKRKEQGTAKGASALTSKIKCVACGCNFRRVTQSMRSQLMEKHHYWRCAEHGKGCQTVGLREDVFLPFLAAAIGIEKWDEQRFWEKVSVIYVSGKSDLEIHFLDGTVKNVHYVPPKKGHPCSEQQKAYMREVMKSKWSPERRAKMSQYMKNLRKECGENWQGK